ncbi:putative F-box and associated interaction domains-containing protein [Heracleum sosnowskyi]|uniref:F-box and associated interaction domains-containing protein n=1 Tax=Heracleum sosnowskyi TaxID=360622 RepID=A0AAD8LZ54_9APIA|nr:putative F-box and associated interaction domains-containing protein [Heracleum sosnowskyi]
MNLNQDKLRKIRKCKLKEDNQRNALVTFPHDILLDIVSRLPITSVMQSMFVCRSWHNLSLHQNLSSLHFFKAATRNPLLIFHSDDPIQNELSFAEIPCSDDDGKGMVKKFSTPFSVLMPKFTVVGSCNGLLCLCDSLYKDAVYIYNPFTRDYKELPKTRQYEEETVVWGFGYLPGTNKYKVVKVVHQWILSTGIHNVQRTRMSGTSKSEVFVFTLGGNTWRNVGLAPRYLERKSQEALCTNGRLHWVTLGVRNIVHGLIIISFDLAEEKFYEIPRPDFSDLIESENYHLAILRGCLSAVVYGHGLRRDLEIWLMRDYNVKESWVKEFKIRAYVPESPFRKLQRPVLIWRNSIIRATLRVLCTLENGEILIEYRLGKFAVYDPQCERYKDITFKGMQRMLQTVVHMGSLTQSK